MDTLIEMEKLRKKILADEKFKKNIPNEGLFFSAYQKNPSRKNIMIILQNPGYNNEDEKDSKPFQDWIRTKQKTTFNHIMYLLKKYYPDPNNNYMKYNFTLNNRSEYETYVQKEFFKDIYVTDLIKIRGSTSFSDKIYDNFKDDCVKIISNEILSVRPKLLISFGTRVWDYVRNEYNVKQLSGKDELKEKKVMDVHGYPFYFNLDERVHVIPLAFPPGLTHYLRSSYFDYFEEGLKEVWTQSNK